MFNRLFHNAWTIVGPINLCWESVQEIYMETETPRLIRLIIDSRYNQSTIFKDILRFKTYLNRMT